MALTGNKATLSMNKVPTIFSMAKDLLKGTPLAGQSTLLVMLVITALVVCFMCVFLKTKLGLAIRATGSNADMVRSSSINPTFTTTVGLCVSNAFTALSGCLMAQQQKNFEINMGSGMVTVALASLLIGGVFVARHKPIPLRAVGAVLGAVVFRIIYALALRFNMPAFMLKAVSSIIVVLAISGPYLRKQFPLMVRRWKAAREGRNA
jgi:putative ABC transport system permease protein